MKLTTTAAAAGMALLLASAPIAFAKHDGKGYGKAPKAAHGEKHDRLRGMDVNGDGVVTRGEWRGDAAKFDRLDTNRDGVLSSQDWKGRNDNRRGGRFNGLDTNRDGVVTRGEWRGNDHSFRRHDRNNDGVISGPEMQPGSRSRNR